MHVVLIISGSLLEQAKSIFMLNRTISMVVSEKKMSLPQTLQCYWSWMVLTCIVSPG